MPSVMQFAGVAKDVDTVPGVGRRTPNSWVPVCDGVSVHEEGL